MFNLSHAGRRERVDRRRGERFADECVIERDRFGGGSVLVWVWIMGGWKTLLIVINGNINAETCINDVRAVEALPFIQMPVHISSIYMRVLGQFIKTKLTLH